MLCNKNTEKWAMAGFLFAVFIFFVVFFTRIHPVVVVDMDDWLYLYKHRSAFPSITEWNPAKVFPEIIMPLCGSIAAYVFFPLIGDYISATTLSFGLFLSFSVTVYTFFLQNFLRQKIRVPIGRSFLLSIVFLSLHFLIFRTGNSGNTHLLFSVDITCYFNYTIPALLNASLIMWLMTNDILADFFSSGNIGRKALFLLLSYLAIFSNLYQSIMLATFCGVEILFSVVESIRKGGSFNLFFRLNITRFVIILLWGVSALFELSGARADSLNAINFTSELRETIKNLLGKKMNTCFLLLVGCIVFVYLFIRILNNLRHQSCGCDEITLIKLFVVFLIVVFYLVLLCGKTGAWRITRGDVLLSAWFFILVDVVLMLAQIAVMSPKSILAFPLVSLIILCSANTSGKTFQVPNTVHLPEQTAADISRDLIDQVIKADQNGQIEMEILVPLMDTDDNWPYAFYGSTRICDALYKHGIIAHKITATFVPTEEMNLKYHF